MWGMRHGFLLIDKPEGPTSHDMVSRVRKVLGERKVGHLGTLDPAATGLLVLAVGAKALKVIEFFSDLEKEYEADITFGSVSTTYDREGVIEKIEPKPGWKVPSIFDMKNAISDRFMGVIDQVPPAASAVQVGGERAYRKMRQGKPVDLPTRSVEISMCDILEYEYPKLRLYIRCSSGTYIRSLAHDLGTVLRCGGYLTGLRRTMVGDWSVENATDPDDAAWAHVIPLKEVLAGFPKIELTDEEAEHIRHGRGIDREVHDGVLAWHDDLPIAVLKPLRDGSRQARARKVL